MMFALRQATCFPSLDLSKTIGAIWFGPTGLVMLQRWYLRLVKLVRIGLVLIWVLSFLASYVPPWTGLISMLAFTIVASCVSVVSFLLLSPALLNLLVWQFEFWFATLLNTSTWILVAFLFHDARSILCASMWMITQLIPLLDASVYTIRSSVRTSRLWLLVEICILVHCAIDEPSSARADTSMQASFTIHTTLLNTSLTLCIFVLNKTYKRRNLCHPQWVYTHRIIPCVIIRSKLIIVPSDRILEASASSPLRLVPLQYTAIQSTRLVLPCCGSSAVLKEYWRVLLYCCGYGGLLLCVASTWLTTQYPHAFNQLIVVLSTTSLGFTLVFCLVFGARYQLELLRMVAKNFDSLFVLFQGAWAGISLADCVRWQDPGVLAFIVSSWLWLQWIFLLDALTPDHKRQLGFYKRLAVPMIVGLLMEIALVIHSLFVLDGQSLDIWHGRSITLLHIEIQTKSFAVYRLGTIGIWLLRLLYEILVHEEDELMFIRGHIDYECPPNLHILEGPPASQPPIPQRRVLACN